MTHYDFDVTPSMLTDGWHMPILTTTSERLTIRPFRLQDFDAINPIITAGFGVAPEIERRFWLEWQVRSYIALAKMYQPPYGDRAVTLTATGEVIGSVGLVQSYAPFDTLPYFTSRSLQPPSGLSTPEIGLYWVIAQEHQRMGYAVEAARCLIAYAFGEMHLKQIVATTSYDNHASIGVMRKLGMSIERNPKTKPDWFQIVGILANPKHSNRKSNTNPNHPEFTEENA